MENAIKPENLEKAQLYVDFVKNNLEPLAQHLKVSVEWLWNILVMQARVEAIVYLLLSIGMFITTIILSIMFFKNIKKATFKKGYKDTIQTIKHKKTGEIIDSLTDDWGHKKDYEITSAPNETNISGYISIVTGIAMVFMLLTSVVTTASNLKIIVTGLVNPEFRAIEKIVEYAKPATHPKANP
jgi:hypothetical protein